MFLVKGQIELQMIMQNGEKLVLDVLNPGSTMG